MESEELLLGCEEGLYEKLDWTKLGGKDKYMPEAVNDCGVGAIVYSFIMAYDGDKIKGDAPKSWADFWNVQKWPGKRGAYKDARIMIDGAESTLADLKIGDNPPLVQLRLGLDQKTVQAVNAHQVRSR